MRKELVNIVLLVEDNPGDARLLKEMFNEQGLHNTELTHAGSMSEAEKHLAERTFDIILLDLELPDARGLEAVRRARAAAPRVTLVVLTGLDDESLGVQALQEGAQDYLIKGQIESRGLLRALRYAIERKTMEGRLLQKVEELKLTNEKLGVAFHDVSAARQMAQEMTHSAQHDFLTGLPNRILLSDRISQAIALAPRHLKQFAVMFLDLDGFKHINDSLGHPVGDKLLQSVAKRLVACVRGSDTVSRQGGDEFVVLLSEAEQWEDSAILARRMLLAVSEVHHVDQHLLHVTTSIGVSVYPDDGQDAETLIKNADTAMYQAKENGHQSYRFFKPEMNVQAEERQSIEESLRHALDRREFALHYQPKINLKTGVVSGAEALIRWTHPTRGPVSPALFIPIAEECGLILPIGRWVLREACVQARAWIEAGLPLTSMAVNVSAMELQDEDFLKNFYAILSETGLDASFLELEPTESVLMKCVEPTASILQTLRKIGVKVAIDDFGTGYSSLSYLRKCPIDSLKIDQSFVRQITAAGNDTTIVAAVISMARSLKLRVVAEGVETLEEVAFLQSHHCDEVQGFYFSQPLLPEQFSSLLRTGIQEPAASVLT